MSNLSLPGEPNINDIAQAYEKRFNRIEVAMSKVLAAGSTTLQKVNIETYDNPAESEVVVDWPTSRICWYHDGEWHCTPNPEHNIKVYPDKKSNSVANGAFKYDIGKTLDGYEIIHVEAFNGTVGSGATTIQLVNTTRGMNILTTPLTIASNQKHDNGAAVIRQDGPINNPFRRVHWKDDMWINVLAVGAGSKGLGVYVVYAKPILPTD